MGIKEIIRNTILNPRAFFLQNLGVKQTIVKNTLWLATAEGVSRFLKLILIIYVARILGATEYGKFTFALAFVALFAIFSDFGLSQITTRELAKDQEKEKEFSSILSLKILLGLGTLILMLIGSFFITPDPVIRGIIWILAIYFIADGFSGILYAFFRARQKMEYEAWIKILQAVAVAGAGFFVILNFPSVKNLSYSYLFAGLVALIFVLLFFHFKVCPLSFDWNKSIWKKFLGLSWPLVLGGIAAMIYNQIDSVMMGYWGQITQTGWYNAAYRIIGVIVIPIGFISTSFYPMLSKFLKQSKENLQRIWNYQMEIMILLAVPLMIGGITLAPRIIDFIYSPSFAPAVLAFQILIIMAGITFLYSPFSEVLVVFNQQKKLFWIGILAAGVNIILNLILIPKYSLYGAAFATLLTFLLLFLFGFWFTIKLTSIKPLNSKIVLTLSGTIISCVPMYFLISHPKIYQLNVFVGILSGAIIYFLIFFLLKILSTKLFHFSFN